MVLRLQFKEKKHERAFIKKYKPSVLVDDDSGSDNFVAWQMFWRPNTLICFMGFMGYNEPLEIKKELKSKIKFFDFIAINDLDSRWNNSDIKRYI